MTHQPASTPAEPTPTSTHTASRTPTPWGRVAAIAGVIAIVVALLAAAFAWPGAKAKPAGLSIAVTGDPELISQFAQAAEQSMPPGIEITPVQDRAAAIARVQARDSIGAIVLAQPAPELLTASASGQVPSAMMSQLTAQLRAMLASQAFAAVREGIAAAPPQGDPAGIVGMIPASLPEVTVTDLAPYSGGDPNGIGLTTAGIPLTIGALLAGIALALTVRGRCRRISSVLGFGAVGGLLAGLVLGPWLEVFPGPFGAVWLALSLSLAATAGLFAGLHSVLGKPGIGLAALVTLFAAMPWAAFAVPYQFLPAGVGEIGQWLIPGATSTLSRSISYFPDAATAHLWWILAAWAAAAFALILLGRAGARNAHSFVASDAGNAPR
ncbi:MAG: hypothetical protein LBH48_04010 [Bifidobacteriaceae bacterium]|jgi:hypothetical protein|nr:hypothetical protein [Bifidobacteriaceae bacterium]